MKLTRHTVGEKIKSSVDSEKSEGSLSRGALSGESIWAADGMLLDGDFSLASLLQLPASEVVAFLTDRHSARSAPKQVQSPIEDQQEVWAAGVTYLRSREARMEESQTADVYDRVYDAKRPEVFFKGNGWRVRGPSEAVRIRRDSDWNVPEPELAIVINSGGEIVGYTAGNDVSSRSIEGENPLYLPQAKVYNGSAALGDGIVLATASELTDIDIRMQIERHGKEVFSGSTNTSQLKRSVQELADCLCAELDFPHGVVLMTGTCLVPDDPFTLQSGDRVAINVGDASLSNTVES